MAKSIFKGKIYGTYDPASTNELGVVKPDGTTVDTDEEVFVNCNTLDSHVFELPNCIENITSNAFNLNGTDTSSTKKCYIKIDKRTNSVINSPFDNGRNLNEVTWLRN